MNFNGRHGRMASLTQTCPRNSPVLVLRSVFRRRPWCNHEPCGQRLEAEMADAKEVMTMMVADEPLQPKPSKPRLAPSRDRNTPTSQVARTEIS